MTMWQMRVRSLFAALALLLAFTVAPGFAQSPSVSSTHVAGNSYGYFAAFSAAVATATQTSGTAVDAGYFKEAEIFASWSGATGSPAGCAIQVAASADGISFVNSGAAVSVTPGTSSVAVFTGALGTTDKFTYSCTTYPTAGTLTLEVVYK